MTVALNTTLTEELIAEGVERELVSKIQAMRKEADFEITDRIYVYYQASGRALAALQVGAFGADVLAVGFVEGENAGAFTKQVDVNGEKVTLGIAKA